MCTFVQTLTSIEGRILQLMFMFVILLFSISPLLKVIMKNYIIQINEVGKLKIKGYNCMAFTFAASFER